MRTGWATVAAALLSAAASPAAAQLPARWPRAPLIEVARAQVHADGARERYGLSGRGSTLCLVDTGIDETIAPDRVRARWDPHGAPRGHALEVELGGAVYGPGEATGSRGDPHGHGTAMASIAAGEDGLAPDAALLVAAAWDEALEGFPDDAVLRAIRFCRAIAAEEPSLDEARMVILLSLGGHDGDHDGTGAFERGIVREAGPVPVVVAAGNDGERAIHAAGRLFDGEESQVTLQVPRALREDAALQVTLRLEGRGARARLVSPSGAEAPLAPGTIAVGGARVEVVPRDDAWAVTLHAVDGVLPSGTWAIAIDGPARFDAWLAGARLGATFFSPALGGPHVIDGEAITIPATAPELISVGATVARPRVEGLETLGAPGEVAAFSSRGPSPAGALEPEVVAPGGWILATLSSDVRVGDPANLVGGRAEGIVDGRVAVRGSSAAAALVAGALLLALELDPGRGPEARELLVSSTGEAGWTPSRGFGALDVERLLARWSGAPTEHREIVVARPQLEPGRPLWLAARGEGRTLSVQLDGEAIDVPLRAGAAWARLAPIGAPARIEAAIDGAALPPIELATAPDPHRPTAIAGGACRVGPPGPSPRLIWLIVGLAVAWAVRSSATP